MLESLTGRGGVSAHCPAPRRSTGVPEGRRTGRAGERSVLRDTCSNSRKRGRDVARHERLEREVPTPAGGDGVLGLAGANRPPHALHSLTGRSHWPRLDSASASIVWTRGKVAVEYSETFLKCCMYNTYSLAMQMVFFITFWKRDPRHLVTLVFHLWLLGSAVEGTGLPPPASTLPCSVLSTRGQVLC